MTGLRRFLVAVALLLLAAPPLMAQSPVDWTAWDQFAARVERAVDDGELREDALQSLRAEIVAWRAQLQEAQKVNSTRIATLREQIAALGPAPAEGETEAEDVAARRKQLNDELAAEQAPVLRAVEAWGRADGIVSEIDRSLRARQAHTLRRQTAPPVLPSSWRAAMGETITLGTGLAAEMRMEATAMGRAALLSRLPFVAVLLVAAALLLTRARRWMDTAVTRLAARASAASRTVLTFLLSLVQLLLPVAGVFLVALALDGSGLTDDWWRPLLQALPVAGLAYFAGRWIARQMFPDDPARRIPVPLPQPQRAIARRYGTWLAAAMALHVMLSRSGVPLSGFRPPAENAPAFPLAISEAAAGVWHLPPAILGGLAMFRLASVLRRAPRFATAEPPPYRMGVAALLGRAARLVAIAGPLLVAAGFVAAGQAALWPMAMTLGLVGLVLLLQQFIADLWALAKRGDEKARDSLTPVLLGFGLVILALPFLVLIWGARPSELAELWARIGQGFSFGGVRLSPGAILTFLIVFSIGFLLTRGVQGALRTSVLPKTRLESGAQSAIISGLGYLGIFMAALTAIGAAGIDLSSLAIVAGALSVGIGFGLQNIVSNFVSGIILLIERPVAVGDWIAVGKAQGIVQRISVRSTLIQTFDRTKIIIPNSDLITKEVTNWTRGTATGRIIVPVTVAYGSDTRKVHDILMDIAEAQPIALIDPAPVVLFAGFGTEGMIYEVRVVLSDIISGITVGSEIRHQIVERFAAEGIEVPFATKYLAAQMTLKMAAGAGVDHPMAPNEGDPGQTTS